jgi:hypothetical protein
VHPSSADASLLALLDDTEERARFDVNGHLELRGDQHRRHPHRLHSEAFFVALCGASPLQASSGQLLSVTDLTVVATARPTTQALVTVSYFFAAHIHSIEIEHDVRTGHCSSSLLWLLVWVGRRETAS